MINYSLQTFVIPIDLSDEVFTKVMNHLTGKMVAKFFLNAIPNVRQC